jgi:hypothetical protein
MESGLSSSGSHLILWHVITQRAERLDLEGRTGVHFALDPTGKFLAVVGVTTSLGSFPDAGLMLIDVANRVRMPVPPDSPHTTGGVAISPDRKVLATGHIVLTRQRQRHFNIVPCGITKTNMSMSYICGICWQATLLDDSRMAAACRESPFFLGRTVYRWLIGTEDSRWT